MVITSEKLDTKEDVIPEDEMNIQNGKYYIGKYSLHWSLDLSSNTFTLNLINRPELGTKVVSRDNPEAEFRVDEPTYKRLYAKMSGNFDSRQLLLNGHAAYYQGPPRGIRIKKYENVIITSW